MKQKIAAIVVLTCASCLFAFNHPEIKWQSVTTNHFIIHYYDKTEPAVYATWKIAEESYAALSALYEYEERDKISIALADYDDYANGFASWTDGSIMIWVTDARFELRGNNTWLRNVITHELAHIVTLEKKSRIQLLDWVLGFDYESPSAMVSLAEPFRTTRFWPEWFAEGTAQLESGRLGNDCWDSRRDMLLLGAVACGRALSLDEMGHFNHNNIRSELVYNQGYSFIKYIESRIGTANFARLWNTGRNTALVMNTFKSLFADQTGLKLDLLYRQWMDSLKAAAQLRVPAAPTAVTPVWSKGFYNYLPKASSDGRWWGWLTNNKDDFSRTDLVIAPYGKTDDEITIQWALSSWDFSPDARRVYFIKQRETSDHGSYYNDLYVLDLATKSVRRLTRGARLYDVAVSPDNQRIACVQFHSGVYSIVQAGLDARNWETVVQGTLGEPFLGLSFSPVKTTIAKPAAAPAAKDTGDSARADVLSTKPDSAAAPAAAPAAPPSSPEYMLATSKVISGRARICVVGMDSKSLTVCGPKAGQQEFPHWGKDGRIYFDADYDGVFNIYSMNADGSGLARHTSTAGGMFQPFLDNNGKLLCARFAGQAFSIVTCAAAGAPYAPPDSPACSFLPVPRPKGEVTIKSRPYEGKLLRPVWDFQTVVSVNDRKGTMFEAFAHNGFDRWSDTARIDVMANILMSRSDALGKKDMFIGVTGAVIHPGKQIADTSWKDTVQNARKTSPGIFSNYFADQGNGRIVGLYRTHTWNEQVTKPLLNNILYAKNLTNKAAANGNTSSDSTLAPPKWVPILVPSIGIQNNTQEISLAFNAQIQIQTFIPAYIAIGGEGMWHAVRDLYFGISPQAVLEIFAFENSTVDIPLWVTWVTNGYINTDIGYNDAGVTRLQCAVIPQFFANVDTSDKNNIKYLRYSAATLGLMFSHGFPLTKYFSCIVKTDNYYKILSDKNFIDTKGLLKGLSDQYYNLSAGASFVFPLWRQINGGPVYADALYGEVGYDFSIYASTPNLGGRLERAFLDPSFEDNHIYPQHLVTAGTRLGFFKSYSFARTLSAKVLWDVMRNDVGVNFSIGF